MILYMYNFQAGRDPMAGKIIIYGKQGWPYTVKAREAFGNNAEFIDVKLDQGRLEEMLKFSKGARNVPVIVEDGKVLIGYGGSLGGEERQGGGGEGIWSGGVGMGREKKRGTIILSHFF